MSYRITIRNSVKTDLKKLKDSYLKDRFMEIVETLKENPYSPKDNFEKLLPSASGLYSRRLNHQHRVVYRINEQEKTVEIYSAWTHYGG
jgi:Txe/YoeB family toxin of toxin-antitoxin system